MQISAFSQQSAQIANAAKTFSERIEFIKAYTSAVETSPTDPYSAMLTKYQVLFSNTDKSFDPDQPRDERGRWTGGYGSASAEERLARFNSNEFKAGHGIVLTGKELRAAKLEEMQQMVVHSDTPVGNTDESWNDPEKLFAEMKEYKWAFNDFDMRVLGSGLIYRNGEIQIQATTDRYLKDGLEQVASRIDQLQESNPIPRLDLRIGERGAFAAGSNALAHAEQGGSLMRISPTKGMNPEAMNNTATELAESGWWMPSAANNSQLDYVVAHEWGHLIDRDNRSVMEQLQSESDTPYLVARNMFYDNNSEVMKSNASNYGLKSWNNKNDVSELHAEYFAEWHLTNGQTSNPAVQLAAKEFGWK